MNLHRHLHQEPMVLQLAPFIDVILFLLVFFLMTWNVARYEAELNVSLPVAAQAEPNRRMPGEILVNVDKSGAIIINRRVLQPAELLTILTQVAADFPDQAVILRADSQTPYQDVIRVIDLCKQAKVWNIAFATLPPEQSK